MQKPERIEVGSIPAVHCIVWQLFAGETDMVQLFLRQCLTSFLTPCYLVSKEEKKCDMFQNKTTRVFLSQASWL